MTLDLSELERRMRPGAWDSSGFLRPASSLNEILDADAHEIRALGADPEAVGDRLAELVQAAAGSDVARPIGVGDFDVELHRQRGMITCPWAADEFEACHVGRGSRPTANQFVVRHRPSGQQLKGFELTAHLVGDHGFFGGPGTKFRIDPREAVAVLGVAIT